MNDPKGNRGAQKEARRLLERAESLDRSGHWDEAVDHYHRTLSAAQHEGDDWARAYVLRRMGEIKRKRGDMGSALRLFHTSQGIFRKLGDRKSLSYLYNNIGLVFFGRGKWKLVKRYFGRALRIARVEGDKQLEGQIFNNLGIMSQILGHDDRSIRYFERALPCYRLTNHVRGIAQTYNNIGMYYRDRRKWGDAVRYYEKSLETSLELGETVLIGIASLNIALAKSHLNDLEGAKGYCGQAFEIFRKLDDKLGIAESHLCLGIINRHKKRYAMARNSIGKSIQLNRRIQNNLGLAEAFREMALLYWDQGKSKQVLKYLGKSFRVFRELKATRYVADIDKQIRDLEEIYFRIAREMGEEVESKDTYTFGHCQRVARYAVRLAEELDLSENEIKAILVAAFLHDLGKVKIPKEILIKPKKLTPDEYLAVTYHPAWGVEMLESVEFPWEVKSLILHHQERYDGQGYPEGLAGKKIPLGARIIAIADFFDALTTDRPYRKAMSLEETFALMVREREKILDPQLLDVFLSLVRKRFPPGKSLLGQMVCQGLSESASTGQMKSPAPRRKVPA